MTDQINIDEILENAAVAVPLPETAVEIVKKSSDPSTSMQDISDILNTDQAMAGKILSIANSAFYGMRRQVATVNEAVVLLGVRTVRNLALTASMSTVAVRPVAGYGLPRRELFKHSLVMANVAKQVNSETNKSMPEEAYTAGLLHDLGKLVLTDYVGEKVEIIKERAHEQNISFAAAERSVLGTDHAEVAAALAEKWELSDFLADAIRDHHGLSMNGRGGSDATSLTAVCIVSNSMGRRIGSGKGENETDDPPIQGAVLEVLGMTGENLEELVVVIEKNMEAATEMVDSA